MELRESWLGRVLLCGGISTCKAVLPERKRVEIRRCWGEKEAKPNFLFLT